MPEAVIINEKEALAAGLDPALTAMARAGVHRGHAKSKHHPGMEPYIWGVRNTIEIIDLAKTKEKLDEALEFLKGLAVKRGMLLLVGTQPAAREAVKALGAELGYPVVSERWIGGTLTNFKTIAKRIETLETIERDKAGGAFEKLTKKERLRLDEELARLRRDFEGLRPMTRLPDALFVVNTLKEGTALREAKRLGIPVIALADTNTDPRIVDYPIPSNDDAKPAIEYMVGCFAQALREGLQASIPGVESQVGEKEGSTVSVPENSIALGTYAKKDD